MNSESYEQEKNNIDLFKAEIEAIKKKEMEKKSRKEKFNPHFEDINPEELTEEDRLIYEKFKNGNVTSEEFLEYRDKVIFDTEKREVDEIADSRSNFCAWINNKILEREWLKEIAQNKNP